MCVHVSVPVRAPPVQDRNCRVVPVRHNGTQTHANWSRASLQPETPCKIPAWQEDILLVFSSPRADQSLYVVYTCNICWRLFLRFVWSEKEFPAAIGCWQIMSSARHHRMRTLACSCRQTNSCGWGCLEARRERSFIPSGARRVLWKVLCLSFQNSTKSAEARERETPCTFSKQQEKRLNEP